MKVYFDFKFRALKTFSRFSWFVLGDRIPKWLHGKMDNDAENVEENEKYSFLLASAIRNEDPEQFFSIYDSILPKNIPEEQVKLVRTLNVLGCIVIFIVYSSQMFMKS